MSARTAAFLLIALTLLVIALSTGAAIYYLLFWMLIMMLVLALESTLATLFSIRIAASSQKNRAVRGDSVSIRMTIQRYTVLPVGLVDLEVSAPDDERAVGHISLILPPIRKKEYRYSVACPHRGHYQLGVSRVRVSDVFGLFSFSKKMKQGNASLDVVPRIKTIPAMSIEPGDLGPQGPVRVSEDMSSPSGVRPWQDGDHRQPYRSQRRQGDRR